MAELYDTRNRYGYAAHMAQIAELWGRGGAFYPSRLTADPTSRLWMDYHYNSPMGATDSFASHLYARIV
eukprot:scaffold173553_cov37-Prasinocladus_malaysianus.AAC.1